MNLIKLLYILNTSSHRLCHKLLDILYVFGQTLKANSVDPDQRLQNAAGSDQNL